MGEKYPADYLGTCLSELDTKFSALIDIWVEMINLTFVLRSLKRCCDGNQIIFRGFLQTTKLTAFGLSSDVTTWNAVSPSA